MDEPACTFWMQDAYSRSQDWSMKTGRWLTEESWPPANVTTRALTIRQDGLDEGPAEQSAVTFQSPQTTGIEGGCWISWSCEADSPGDQRPDDGRSQVFDSQPLAESLEVLGQAKAVLDVACDQPEALVGVRLCDVDEVGASTLVARGVLNLTHREGHMSPQPLVPGKRYRVEVSLGSPPQARALDDPVAPRLALSDPSDDDVADR
jgi:predicted acyl esterase